MSEYEDFFKAYAVLNEGTEIPKSFSSWCSLSAVSAVLARRCWIDMGPFMVFPNLYLVLVAGSGTIRKSTAINVARKMLKLLPVPPNFVGQKMSPEKLIEELKSQSVGGIDVSGKTQGQGYLVTDELTNFLNAKSTESGIGGLLIDLYDCVESFTYGTRSQGKEVIKDCQLGLLAATTPLELRKGIPPEAIGSGLASRILFIYEDRRATPVTFPTYTQKQLEAQEWCVRALQRYQSIGGEVKLTAAARAWCEECYTKRCFNSKLFDDQYLSGYASRRFTHILKLAINLNVGLHETLLIDVSTLEVAELLARSNEEHLQRVVKLVTMNDKGEIISFVLSVIKKAGRITREDLLSQIAHRLDSRELTEVAETLLKSGQITVANQGTKIYYLIKDSK